MLSKVSENTANDLHYFTNYEAILFSNFIIYLLVFPIQAPFEFDQNNPARSRSTDTNTQNIPAFMLTEFMNTKP